ncbi:hypothetical protein M569_12352 [Genlisea aurea]|uniref:Glabrous enhancer-binding protein-like DBD domain-containing protein n=1 Tax=Genlisea aurea TaxID=192259 RepID=S8C6P6_9LAMI|nr:hypothetical protein M569_12352 [Genlisea aurea]
MAPENGEADRMNLSASTEGSLSGDEFREGGGHSTPLSSPKFKSPPAHKSFLDSSQCSSPSASDFIVLPVPKSDAKRKAPPASSRKFSDEDEIALLKGHRAFWANGRNQKWAEFHSFVKNSLSRDFSKGQVYEKIRKLKKKFEANLERALENGEIDHSEPHETLLFELSMTLWGNECKVTEELQIPAESKHHEETTEIEAHDGKKTLELGESIEEVKASVEMDENSNVSKRRKKSKNHEDPIEQLKASAERDENPTFVKKKKKKKKTTVIDSHDGKNILEAGVSVDELRSSEGREEDFASLKRTKNENFEVDKAVKGSAAPLRKKKTTESESRDEVDESSAAHKEIKKTENKKDEGKKSQKEASTGRDENSSVVSKEIKNTLQTDEAIEELNASAKGKDENPTLFKEKKKNKKIEGKNHDGKRSLEVDKPDVSSSVHKEMNKTRNLNDERKKAQKTTSVGRHENSPVVSKEVKGTESKDHHGKDNTLQADMATEELNPPVVKDENPTVDKEKKKQRKIKRSAAASKEMKKTEAEMDEVKTSPLKASSSVGTGKKDEISSDVSKAASKNHHDKKTLQAIEESKSSSAVLKKRKFDSKNRDGKKALVVDEPARQLTTTSVGSYENSAAPERKNNSISSTIEEKKSHHDNEGNKIPSTRNKTKADKKPDKKDQGGKISTAEGDGSKEEFESDFPLLRASFDVDPYTRKMFFSIGREERTELEEEWKEIRDMELSLYNRRVALIRTHLLSNGGRS